jgi:hemoglobin
MNKEILNIDDIKLLVDSFYRKVKEDKLLATIFNERIKDNWPEHLEKMYRFWQTVLLNEHTYYGSPFVPHANLPIDEEYFNQWIFLFCQTIDEIFAGEKASEAKWRAEKMAEMFLHKIKYCQDNPGKTIL